MERERGQAAEFSLTGASLLRDNPGSRLQLTEGIEVLPMRICNRWIVALACGVAPAWGECPRRTPTALPPSRG